MTASRVVEELIYSHKENLQPTPRSAEHANPWEQNDRLKGNFVENSPQFREPELKKSMSKMAKLSYFLVSSHRFKEI